MTTMSTLLRRHSVVILVPQWVDDPYGGVTIDWNLPATEIPKRGWMTQTGFDQSPDASRLDDASRWLLWIPGKVEQVNTDCRVRYSGTEYRVYGRPRLMPQPRGKGLTMIPLVPIEGR